ncbi:MAG: sigma-70 family RNA polymerase sigma factor [Gammaproteobacteria bacterium]|jgi:RNA polymerase sigma-70 factor (ECF subfamily)
MRGDNPAPGSDEDLMLRYGRGDLEAFHSLYNRHRASLYRYFLRQAGPDMAEQLFRELWACVIQARRRYRPRAGFRTWLYTLARHRLVDYWRAQGRHPARDDAPAAGRLPDAAGARAGLSQPAAAHDCIDQVLAQVAALPDAQRETFLLRHEAGLSPAQIAEATKIGIETSRSRLRHALERLRMALPEECLKEP